MTLEYFQPRTMSVAGVPSRGLGLGGEHYCRNFGQRVSAGRRSRELCVAVRHCIESVAAGAQFGIIYRVLCFGDRGFSVERQYQWAAAFKQSGWEQ